MPCPYMRCTFLNYVQGSDIWGETWGASVRRFGV